MNFIKKYKFIQHLFKTLQLVARVSFFIFLRKFNAPWKKGAGFIILSLAIGFLSVYSLTIPGLPPTHDGEYHILRFEQFHKSLSEGTLYPRWAKDFNNGYGIPLFNYVYPLPNYVSSLAHFLGANFINSFKLNMIIATITGAVFFYLWAKKYWGEIGGLVSSTFYSFSP